MKVALGNLGSLKYALKASLEDLDIEVCFSEPNTRLMYDHGARYLPIEMCYPLKLLLGNYLSQLDQNPDVVIYYGGCDMCNLTPVNYAFNDILNDLNCCPDSYICRLNSKKDFVVSYYETLRKISGKSIFDIALSIKLGLKKYEAFNFIDQVFYQIRPAFENSDNVDSIYDSFYNRLIEVSDDCSLDKINNELLEIHREYSVKVSYDTLKVGLIGDVYSLNEPYVHQYCDKKLGSLGVALDRWSTHRLVPESDRRIQDKACKRVSQLPEIIQKDYGVFTDLEVKKIRRYVNRGFDGLIFIAPLECNPNDALRNLINKVQIALDIPVLTLLFDEHTSPLAVQVRLEAFVDMLNKRKALKYRNNRAL
jgi:predicted nucleotide-binding protein (sugar kinase/HSP70/actin superfamily)